MARSRLSTAGFAILGLLALRPFSAYELTQQIHRGVRYMQPASERNLYAEPKRLAAAGLVRMRREQVGRRSRTIYEITPAGREACAASWPPRRPRPNSSSRPSSGSSSPTRAASRTCSPPWTPPADRSSSSWTTACSRSAATRPTAGLPQRLHLIMLFARFYVDFLLLLRDWVALARREVASWPTTSDLGLTDGTRQMLEDLLRLADQLTQEPEQATTGRAVTQGPAQRARRGGRQGSTREPASMS